MPSHPKGLAVLYLTEVWERFSFYGLKALLVLYLNSGVLSSSRFSDVFGSSVVITLFGQPQSQLEVQALSSQLNELYAGAAYITPLLGGMIADSLTGSRAALLSGGVLMAAGHGCMAVERSFLVGLLLLALGNGLFKPTVSSTLARLYEPRALAPLRDRGFAIFYTGINIGALMAPLVCGSLQQAVGYDAGFSAAGVGMLIGLACYIGGERHLPSEDLGAARGCRWRLVGGHHAAHRGGEETRELERLELLSTPRCAGDDRPVEEREAHRIDAELEAHQLESLGCGTASSARHIDHSSQNGRGDCNGCDGLNGPNGRDDGNGHRGQVPRSRLAGGLASDTLRATAALVLLCTLVIPFWVAYEQLSNTVPLYFRDVVDRSFGGKQLPAASLQSFNPLFSVLMMPALTTLWTRQAQRGNEPSPTTKMAIGCLLQGAGWLLLAVGSRTASSAADSKMPLALPLLSTFLLTCGQLYLAPIGLALVSGCCSARARSSAIGIWFMAGGVAGLIAGPIGTLYSYWSPPAFFSLLCGLCVANGCLIYTVAPRLVRMAQVLAGSQSGEAKRDGGGQ